MNSKNYGSMLCINLNVSQNLLMYDYIRTVWFIYLAYSVRNNVASLKNGNDFSSDSSFENEILIKRHKYKCYFIF